MVNCSAETLVTNSVLDNKVRRVHSYCSHQNHFCGAEIIKEKMQTSCEQRKALFDYLVQPHENGTGPPLALGGCNHLNYS